MNLSDPAAVQRLWHQTTQRMNKVDPTHGILFISGKPSADESGSRLIITYAKESAAVFSLLSSPAVQKLLDDTLAEVAGVPVPFELVLSQPDPAPAAASVPTPTPIPDQTAAPAVTPVATSSFASALDKVSASAPASASASTAAPDPADAPLLDVYDSYAASYSDPSEPDYGYGAYGDPSEPDYQPPMQPAQSTQPAQPTRQNTNSPRQPHRLNFLQRRLKQSMNLSASKTFLLMFLARESLSRICRQSRGETHRLDIYVKNPLQCKTISR